MEGGYADYIEHLFIAEEKKLISKRAKGLPHLEPESMSSL